MFKKQLFLIAYAVISVFLIRQGAYAQSGSPKIKSDGEADFPKFEVGTQFSMLGVNDPYGLEERTEAGFGGRFSYNLNRYFALEAEVNLFPKDYRFVTTPFNGGRITQGLFGLKAGMRKEKFGIFGKARPGFQSSGRASRATFPDGNGPDPRNPFGFEYFRATQLSMDVGGVFEYYPTRRTIIRFDLGDTITRYPDVQFFRFPEGTPFTKDIYTHRLQLSAGFGFRF